MRKVWKYVLEPADVVTLRLPMNAQILSVHGQGGQPHRAFYKQDALYLGGPA